MEIWLKQGDESLRLPILPSSFEKTLQRQNETVNITNYGEVNLIGKSGLDTITLSSFFPNKQYGFVQYAGYPKPYDCIKLLNSWMDNPIRVTITKTDINMLSTIESFTHSEQDGTGDVYYSIELKKYRKPSIEKKGKSKVSKTSTKIIIPENKRNQKLFKSTTYIVKKGDTLMSIAKKLTGSNDNYRAIANQNNIKNIKSLKPGQKLVIKI